MDKEQVGIFIAKQRKACGMTQKELAEKLYVTDKAVSKWERGLSYPDISQLEPLADALNVSVIEIMRGEQLTETTAITMKDAAQMVDDSLTLSDEKLTRLKARNKTTLLFCIMLIMFLISLTLNIINFTKGASTDSNETYLNTSTYMPAVMQESDSLGNKKEEQPK